MTARFTVDIMDQKYPLRPPVEIEALFRRHNGWWANGHASGIVAFNDEIDAVNFSTALAYIKPLENQGDPSPEHVPGQKTENSRPSRAPTNLQAMSMVEEAVRRAKHAKMAKVYLKPGDAKAKVLEHATFRLDWGSDSDHAAAMYYLTEAFKEYLPAIFDVAVKKAEEADRAARDAIIHWGPKA